MLQSGLTLRWPSSFTRAAVFTRRCCHTRITRRRVWLSGRRRGSTASEFCLVVVVNNPLTLGSKCLTRDELPRNGPPRSLRNLLLLLLLLLLSAVYCWRPTELFQSLLLVFGTLCRAVPSWFPNTPEYKHSFHWLLLLHSTRAVTRYFGHLSRFLLTYLLSKTKRKWLKKQQCSVSVSAHWRWQWRRRGADGTERTWYLTEAALSSPDAIATPDESQHGCYGDSDD